jgi:hypothetical protein
MSDSSGTHKPLRQEWAETPADVSYRFVVSPGTLRAADAVIRDSIRKRKSWWQRVIALSVRATALFVRYSLGGIICGLIVLLLGWLSSQLALVVDRALEATQRLGSGKLLPIVIFLVTFLGAFAGFFIVIRRLVRLPSDRLYREFYAGNEFLLEGRKSHLWLWFDEQSAGAIRRWSNFERLVEFEEGMWLFLRRRTTTFGGLQGILISKDSLPDSCAWSELQMYLRQRLQEADKAQRRDHIKEQKTPIRLRLLNFVEYCVRNDR